MNALKKKKTRKPQLLKFYKLITIHFWNFLYFNLFFITLNFDSKLKQNRTPNQLTCYLKIQK